MGGKHASSKLDIVSTFVQAWAEQAAASSVLQIHKSMFSVFSDLGVLSAKEVATASDAPEGAHFDLILGDVALGMRPVELVENEKSIRVPQNWLELLKALDHVEKHGTVLFLLGPLGFSRG